MGLPAHGQLAAHLGQRAPGRSKERGSGAHGSLAEWTPREPSKCLTGHCECGDTGPPQGQVLHMWTEWALGSQLSKEEYRQRCSCARKRRARWSECIQMLQLRTSWPRSPRLPSSRATTQVLHMRQRQAPEEGLPTEGRSPRQAIPRQQHEQQPPAPSPQGEAHGGTKRRNYEDEHHPRQSEESREVRQRA